MVIFMKMLIIIIIGFLAIIYIYTFIKYKKRKKNEISVVNSYRENYIEKKRFNNQSDITDNSSYQQITKYNSSVDYIEWNDFVSEINEQKQNTNVKQNKFPKQLQY